MTDDLTLTITPAAGGDALAFEGWTAIRVSRGIERVPSDFQVTATDRNPSQPFRAQIHAGDKCQVLLGGDAVLTGYVDRVIPSYAPGAHSVTVLGRSKCEDLVDCSAVFETFQLMNMSLPALAEKLCTPFGIKVNTIDGDTGAKLGSVIIQQVAVTLTETPMEVIEQVCRYAGALAYDNEQGDLVLSRVGTTEMASGLEQGQNIQSAIAFETMDQRFSKVSSILVSNQFITQPVSANFDPLLNNSLAYALDPGVLRYRPLLIVAEQNDVGYRVATLRATWEVNRRYGRSKQIKAVVDSWRDSAGKLWQVNALANVNADALGLSGQVWLIAEVSFLRDERGTRAELILMPKEAFSVEPIILNPAAAAVNAAANQGAAGNPSAPDGITVTPLPPVSGAAQ